MVVRRHRAAGPGPAARRGRCRGSGANPARPRGPRPRCAGRRGDPRDGHRGQEPARPGGSSASSATSRANAVDGRPVGELAVDQQLPHVLEGPARGQVDGRVLAVVEEALLSAHVTDRGLGDHHALEPPRHVGAVLVRRPEQGRGQQVAERHHADQVAAVDHGQMAVVVVGQARPGRAGLLVGAEHVGVGGHPEPHRLGRGVGRGRRGPQQVALGEDPDHACRRR